MKLGTYEEITETGFNISEILDSYNKAMTVSDNKEAKKEFLTEKDQKKKDQDRPAVGNTTKKIVEEEEEAEEEGKEKKEKEKQQEDLIVAEEKMEGGVGLKDFVNLFSFSVGSSAIVIYIILSIICAALQLAPSYILSSWTRLSQEEQ